MKLFFLIFILAGGLFLFPGCRHQHLSREVEVHPEGHPETLVFKDYQNKHGLTDLDTQIYEIMEQYRIAGLQAAVTVGDTLVWDNAYGWFDLHAEIPLQRHHIIRLASISKSFAGLGAMLLVSENTLDLDEDINSYLDLPVTIRNPLYPDTKITTRQLMNHTSSILSGQHAPFVIASRRQNPVSYTLADYFAQDGEFNKPGNWSEHPPGEYFQYSNMGPVVLASIIESLSGQEFSQYMREKVFIPLQMNDSSYNARDLDRSRIARMYRRREENGQVFFTWTPVPPGGYYLDYCPGTNGGLHSPQGGMLSTAADLSSFVLAMTNQGRLGNKQLFTEKIVAEMHRESVQVKHQGTGTFDGLYRKKALCIHITDDLYPGQTVHGHFGSSYGIITNMYYSIDREENFGIIFLINGSDMTTGSRSPFRKLDEELSELLYSYFIRH